MMNNKLHSIFEYQEIKWCEFYNSSKIKNNLTKLEKQGFKPFSYTASGIKSRQYVGVISLAGEVIQVLPKIFDQNSKPDNKINIKGLMYLLSITKKLKISETDISKLSKKIDNLLEVFIYLFAINLFELLNNDFQRNYVHQSDNLKYVKGKINFTNHIKNNYIDKSKFYCDYDEYEDNILFNQILKATVNKCIKFSKSNFQVLQKCDQLLINVEDKNFVNPNICKPIKFTRRNQHYQYIFELAKLLLFGNSPLLTSDDTATFSIMFDMNKLFEEYVYEIIKQHSNELNIVEISSQSTQENIFDSGSSYNFAMKPDIFIKTKDCKKIIIDTKYKRIDTIKSEYNSNQKGISQSDIYQMFAYSQYYGTYKNILLYPKYSSLKDNEFSSSSDDLNLKKPKFNLKVSFLDFTLTDGVKFDDYISGLFNNLKKLL